MGSLAHMLGKTDVMEQLIGFMLFDRPHINQIGPLGEQQFHLTFWIGYLRAPQHTIFFFRHMHGIDLDDSFCQKFASKQFFQYSSDVHPMVAY